MRTDPTETGGLFVGRRPGTAPVSYRALPQRGTDRRRRFDEALAALILLVISLINLTFWGPLPLGWLWVGSQVDYQTGSVSVGILSAFVGLLFTLLGGLMIMRRLDHTWILVRRAAGHDQRSGMLGRIFVITAGLGAIAFGVWFLLINGPGSSLGPAHA
ncbi:MAG TPA: hypothetical protein VGN69_06820 [Solirubrobacteraceae bacterium]|jgi:ABC-type multidrug transport system fused ATPase/permease subunit|nr:hypothetical protein [Solirubrobacteraceae bacterium]